jgi:hypothetical protein
MGKYLKKLRFLQIKWDEQSKTIAKMLAKWDFSLFFK